MHYTHPLDRFMMKHRRKFYFLGAVTIWPSLFAVMWTLRITMDVIGAGWGVLIALCYVLTLIGLGFLFDDHQSEQKSQQPDQ
mgnify:CR=1 FL=1